MASGSSDGVGEGEVWLAALGVLAGEFEAERLDWKKMTKPIVVRLKANVNMMIRCLSMNFFIPVF